MAKEEKITVRLPSEMVKELWRRKDADGISIEKQVENALRVSHSPSEKGGAQSSHPQVIEVEQPKRN